MRKIRKYIEQNKQARLIGFLCLSLFLMLNLSCNKEAEVSSDYDFGVYIATFETQGGEIFITPAASVLSYLNAAAIVKTESYTSFAKNDQNAINKSDKIARSEYKAKCKSIDNIDFREILQNAGFTSCKGYFVYSLVRDGGITLEQKTYHIDF